MNIEDATHDELLEEAVERFSFFALDEDLIGTYNTTKNGNCPKVFYESQVVTFVRSPTCYDPETDVACAHWQGVISWGVGACSYAYDNMEWLLEIAAARPRIKQPSEVEQ